MRTPDEERQSPGARTPASLPLMSQIRDDSFFSLENDNNEESFLLLQPLTLSVLTYSNYSPDETSRNMRELHRDDEISLSMNNSTSTDNSGIERPIYWIVIIALTGFFCLIILFTTRCCRNPSYEHRYLDDIERERRRRRLEAERAEQDEADVNRRLVEQAKRARKRNRFLERELPYRTYEESQTKDTTEELAEDEQDKDVCSVCLERYQTGDVLSDSTVLSKRCFHEFHRECIASWLLSHKECPVCRNIFLRQDAGEKEESGDVEQDDEEPQPSELSTADAADAEASRDLVEEIPNSTENTEQDETV